MAASLATPSATRELLASHGLTPSKTRGQNFLVNEAVLAKIVRAAELSARDAVLEVGPGLGVLTRELVARAGAVVAVELEPELATIARATCEDVPGHLAVVVADAARLEGPEVASAFQELGAAAQPTKLVANLPYAVAATVILQSFERWPALERACVMVQREVADRICAEPGTKSYGAYTVKLALHARVAGRFEVARTNFWPEPHVDSTVVTLLGLGAQDELDGASAGASTGIAASPEAVRRACAVANAAFAMRRKTLVNNLLAAGFAKEAVLGALRTLGIDARTRAEALAPAAFLELQEALGPDLPQKPRAAR